MLDLRSGLNFQLVINEKRKLKLQHVMLDQAPNREEFSAVDFASPLLLLVVEILGDLEGGSRCRWALHRAL